MKFFITNYKNQEEKDELKNIGLYVYDLRHYDEEWDNIYSIEEHILVNRYGTILTSEPLSLKNKYPNNFILYEDFIKKNQKVKSVEELGFGIKSLDIVDFSKEDSVDVQFHKFFPRSSLNNKTISQKVKKLRKYFETSLNYFLIHKEKNIYQIYFKDTSTIC